MVLGMFVTSGMLRLPMRTQMYITAIAVAVYVMWRRKKCASRLLPSTGSLLESAREMVTSRAPWFLLEQTRKLGPVFREVFSIRKLVQQNLRPEFDDEGIPSVFTKRTFHEGHESAVSWAVARKGMAPSFSNTNLLKQMPFLQKKLEQLYQVLDDHSTSGEAVDVPALMTTLTLDFLLASMFGMDCNALQYTARSGSDSEPLSKKILRLIETSLRELHRRLFGFYRKYHFWNAQVREAHQAGQELIQIAEVMQKLLASQLTKHSTEMR